MIVGSEKSIITPVVYYDLLGKPLTLVELYKYQAREIALPKIPLVQLKKQLKNSEFLKKILLEKNGIYSLADRPKTEQTRNSRLKTSQLKWKKVKKLTPHLALIPFVRLVAATGSLTADNTNDSSDFDLLIITESNRLWLTRIFSIIITGLLGKRRHDRLTKDRLCLNCFIEENEAEIKNEAKPHNWHSAQEYGRLIPLLEIKKGSYENFIKQNQWLADFVSVYPRPNSQTTKNLKQNYLFKKIRQTIEWPLSGTAGDWLEKKCRFWQKSRILQKSQRQKRPNDQIYIGQTILMLHPQSKGEQLINSLNLKIKQLYNNSHATN